MGESTQDRLAKALVEIALSTKAEPHELRAIAWRALNWHTIGSEHFDAAQRDMQEVEG